jgi:vacuolar-type H+-ATPase subunit I/STV1
MPEEQGMGPGEQDISESLEPEIQTQDTEPAPEPVEASIDKAEEPRRLRRFLIWTVGLLLLFALGVVAAWFLQIKPMRDQNRVLLADLSDAQQQVESLTSEVERLRPLEPENERLQEQVAQLESHIFLLDVLVDVSKAQLALVEEDPIAAEDALRGTNQRLNQLEAKLKGPDSEAVSGMGDRLALALEEVKTDEFAARRDLEILANNLIALEQRLFGE